MQGQLKLESILTSYYFRGAGQGTQRLSLQREDVLPELGITQAALASHLGVSRLTVSELLHEKRALTAEMTVRVSTVVGGSAESWLRMLEALDLWVVEMKFKEIPRLHQLH